MNHLISPSFLSADFTNLEKEIKLMNNRGGVEFVGQIDNPKFYQDFFAKVDKGIFIEKEKI